MSFPFDLHSAAVSDSHCHAKPMPCSGHAVLLKATAQHGRLSTPVLYCGLEKNGMVRAWHGHVMASVNQTRPHCLNQMGKTHSKPLAAWHGRGTAGARHAMCESALTLILPRSRAGTIWFYTSTSNKRAARPKLYTKSLTRDLKLMYSRFTLVRISIKL